MHPSVFILVLVLAFSSSQLGQSAENGTQLKESLRALDPCVLQSVVSFIYPKAYPPTTTESLKLWCKSHYEAFKCIKEKSRFSVALVKRGMATLVQSMQRLTRKYCTNVNSELSKGFVRDLKCVMEKKLPDYYSKDVELVNSLQEIVHRNYNNSAIELKYLCCSFLKYRQTFLEVGEECAKSKPLMEELLTHIISNELDLICDDDDKLASKVCPTLEPLQVSKTLDTSTGSGHLGAASAAIYLVATLGEPEVITPKRS